MSETPTFHKVVLEEGQLLAVMSNGRFGTKYFMTARDCLDHCELWLENYKSETDRKERNHFRKGSHQFDHAYQALLARGAPKEHDY